ncbi:MAG TPA: hypothetical protein VG126_18375 [Thermoleophilaceae bacterium]|nr:hypothetical protein [Thermoleophilaceae bacterium]
MRRALALVALAAACGAAGCGDSAESAGRSDRLVDFSKRPPFVNSLERDEQSGEFLVTTNRGFFRIDPETDSVRRVRATIAARGKVSKLGTFLELNLDPEGELVGSGHPDQRVLPQYLGYLRSDDGGRNWRVVSRLGTADLHKIIFKHDRLYAWDAVLGALIVSEDGGRSFVEHFTPRGLIIDFEVDPEDPAYILAATDDTVFRSEDEGESWRPLLQREGTRLAWPEPGRLVTASKDGTISVSEDGGETFDDIGRVDGEPYVIDAASGNELYMALSDATLLRSEDGGANWEEEFRP